HKASYTGFRNYNYILQALHDGDWLRVFAIDVCPNHVRSHRCKTTGKVHHGPHIHFGDEKTQWFTWRPLYVEQNESTNGKFYRRFMRHIQLLEINNLFLEPFGVDNGFQTDLHVEQLACTYVRILQPSWAFAAAR